MFITYTCPHYDVWHSVGPEFNVQINKKVLLLLPYFFMKLVNSILELLKNVVKMCKDIFKGFLSDFTHSFNIGFTWFYYFFLFDQSFY